MNFLKKLIVLIILVIIALGVWIWSGSYNIAADAPHWASTRYLIHQLRERSIDARARHVTGMPNLEDPALIAVGADHYAEMCTGCHLAPGMGNTEIRQGLYPRPPDFVHGAPPPNEAFWVIKHGIKMTAMPAWGKTHDDQKIWAMVAYLQRQPHMGVAEYRKLAGLPASGAMVMDQHDAAPAPAASNAGAPAAATSAPAHR